MLCEWTYELIYINFVSMVLKKRSITFKLIKMEPLVSYEN